MRKQVRWSLHRLSAHGTRFKHDPSGCLLIGKLGSLRESTQIGYSSNFLESLRMARGTLWKRLESQLYD